MFFKQSEEQEEIVQDEKSEEKKCLRRKIFISKCLCVSVEVEAAEKSKFRAIFKSKKVNFSVGLEIFMRERTRRRDSLVFAQSHADERNFYDLSLENFQNIKTYTAQCQVKLYPFLLYLFNITVHFERDRLSFYNLLLSFLQSSFSPSSSSSSAHVNMFTIN